MVGIVEVVALIVLDEEKYKIAGLRRNRGILRDASSDFPFWYNISYQKVRTPLRIF